MIFRDGLNASARIQLNKEFKATASHIASRRVKLSDLLSKGKYALIAWGIGDLIQMARVQSGLSTTKLAKFAGISRSSLSRLESGELNIRLDHLMRHFSNITNRCIGSRQASKLDS